MDGEGGESKNLWLGPDGGICTPFGNIPKLIVDSLCKTMDGGVGQFKDLWLGPNGGIWTSFDSIPELKCVSKSGILLDFGVRNGYVVLDKF